MDYDWQLGRACQFHLANEYLLLCIARGMIVIVVQADFSPGYDFRMSRQSFHLGAGVVGSEPCFMRMNADRRIKERIFLSQLNSGIEFRRTVAIADGNHGHDPGFSRASDDLLAIGIELFAVEMCVRVDKHKKTGGGRQASGVGPGNSKLKHFAKGALLRMVRTF